MQLWTFMEYIYLVKLLSSLFSAYVPRIEMAESYSNSDIIFSVFKVISILFSSVCTIYIHISSIQDSLFSISSPTFVICSILDDSHYDRCEVIPHISFDLHFSNNWWYWASSHMLVSHLNVVFFFWKKSILISDHLLIRLLFAFFF